MEVDLPAAPAEQLGRRDIAGAHERIELDQLALRFDHQPAPSLQIEPARYVIGDRVPGTHIDIEAARLALEGAGEVIVLEIGGVRQVHGREPEAGRSPRTYTILASAVPLGRLGPPAVALAPRGPVRFAGYRSATGRPSSRRLRHGRKVPMRDEVRASSGLDPARGSSWRRPRGRRWPRVSAERTQQGPAYAALDLGTNNCRLLVARPTRDGFRVIDAFSRIIRLGEGVSTSGRLSEPAIDRALEALGICRDKM